MFVYRVLLLLCAVFLSFNTQIVFADNASDGVIHDANELFEAVKITCSGISDEIAKVANVSRVNTAVSAAGITAAGYAMIIGISKNQTEKDIDALIDKICNAGGCSVDSVNKMSLEEFYTNVVVPMGKIEELKEQVNQSKKLGNWRTGLMAGTIGTNLVSAIISGTNSNQSELIQHIDACNNMIKAAKDFSENLTLASVSPLDTPIAKKLYDVKIRCESININDIEKIEKRMKGVMGTSVAGAVIGGVGTATSAAANADKYTDVNNRLNLTDSDRRKSENLNKTANIMAGANVGTGIVETGLNASMVNMAKRLISTAERCEEVLQ